MKQHKIIRENYLDLITDRILLDVCEAYGRDITSDAKLADVVANLKNDLAKAFSRDEEMARVMSRTVRYR
jgi:hypothetical protein